MLCIDDKHYFVIEVPRDSVNVIDRGLGFIAANTITGVHLSHTFTPNLDLRQLELLHRRFTILTFLVNLTGKEENRKDYKEYCKTNNRIYSDNNGKHFILIPH